MPGLRQAACGLLCLLLACNPAAAQTAQETRPPPQVEFETGLRLLLDAQYAPAAQLFEQLYARTRSERVRLEWARAAYLMHDYETARQLFNAVLASNPPAPVREKILFFLDDIALAEGRIDYAFSLTQDSNPRAIPSVRNFNIFGLPFQYQPGVDTSPKWGINYRLAYHQGLDEGRRWIASGGFSGTYFADPVFNRSGWDTSLTYRAAFIPRLEFKASYESMDLGPDPQYRYTGLSATLGHELLPWRVQQEWRHGGIQYPLMDYQNSLLSSYRIQLERMLSAAASAGVELGVDRGTAVEAPYSYQGNSYGVLGGYFFAAIETRVTLRWNQAYRTNAADDPVFGIKREDQRRTLSLSFDSPALRWASMRPMLELGYEKNTSTLPLANYDRTLFSITLHKAL